MGTPRGARAALFILAFGFSLSATAQSSEDGQVTYDRGDYPTALRNWSALADQGHATAQVQLGLMYASGHGVPRDNAEAVRWYRKAAEQGNAWGQTNLGYMYEQGRGVVMDDAEAARWYRKAAEADFAEAQINLGQMYEAGRGVPKELAEAAAWYRKAAKQGNARAQTFLSSIENRGRARVVANCLVQVAEWPVRLMRNKLIVDGVINGRKVGVLLDTGATSTLILRSQAARLGLSPVSVRGAYAEGIGGISEVEMVVVQEIMIGDATRKRWSMGVVGERDLGDDVAIVLGEDFFGLSDVEFDLAHNAVRLYHAKNCGNSNLAYWATAGASEVAFETGLYRQPQIRLTVHVNDQPVKAKLDSGASVSLLDSSVAARLGITPELPGVSAKGALRGIGKESVQIWIGPVRSFAVGGEVIRDTSIHFADARAGEMLLGADFLRAHRTLVAHSQKKIYFSYVGGPVFQSNRQSGTHDEQLPGGETHPGAGGD